MLRMLGFLAALALACAPVVHGQESFERLRLKYELERELLEKPLAKLRDQYKAQLLKLKEKYSKAGELEKALVANGAADAGDPEPDTIVERPTEVGSLQKIFLRQKAELDGKRERELKKLNGAYAKNLAKMRGDLTVARKFEEAKTVDAELKKVEAELVVQSIARVKVSADCTITAEDLVAGAERLSGGFRPPFHSVSDVLADTQFTRVPWQKKPKFEVKAEEEGYVYVYSASRAPAIEGDVEKEPVSGMITGPYVDKAPMFRVKLKKNQTFSFRAFEGGVIAKRITVE